MNLERRIDTVLGPQRHPGGKKRHGVKRSKGSVSEQGIAEASIRKAKARLTTALQWMESSDPGTAPLTNVEMAIMYLETARGALR
jgi:hypothetical protein